ncbi:MAG: leucine-rich repeat domain-containing protein [Candidatus Latescibacterota bacterium]
MRRLARGLAWAWLVISAGCGSGGSPAAPPDAGDPGGHADTLAVAPADTVAFADPGLEAAVRAAVGQAEGPLVRAAVDTLTALDASSRGIWDLTGIACLRSLTTLLLAGNQITDVAPLAGLAGLRLLDLDGNQVVDVSPLTALAELRRLVLENNRVTDPSPLLRLEHLEAVELRGNPVEAGALQAFQAALAGEEPAGGEPAGGEETGASGDEVPGAGGGEADGIQTGAPQPEPEGPLPPGDSWIAFVRRSGMHSQLWVMLADGTDSHPVLEVAGWISGLSWAPDGGSLALSAWIEGSGHDVYLVDGVTSAMVRLTTDPAVDMMPLWSPDGEWIAFTSSRDGTYAIYAMRPDGTGLERVTGDPSSSRYPGAWSPDGQWLAFASVTEEDVDLYVIGGEGSGERLLEGGPGRAAPSAWSPDGQWLAFSSDRNGNWDIYVIRPDGSDLRQLTDGPGGDLSPSFSPDGRWIAFISDRGGDQEVYAMPVAGGKPVNLSRTPGPEEQPQWGPAGTTYFAGGPQVPESPFADPNLHKIVRQRYRKGLTEPLTEEDLLRVTTLQATNRSVVDLAGMERMANLSDVWLDNRYSRGHTDSDSPNANWIPDTTYTADWNHVRDLSPLAGLSGLTTLDLTNNPVADLSPLAGLTSLRNLFLNGTRATDLSPLAGLTQLVELSLAHARVADLSPLAGLTSLRRLDVSYNQIQHIGVLLELQLASLNLAGNPLDAEALQYDIPNLQRRGVIVRLE